MVAKGSKNMKSKAVWMGIGAVALAAAGLAVCLWAGRATSASGSGAGAVERTGDASGVIDEMRKAVRGRKRRLVPGSGARARDKSKSAGPERSMFDGLPPAERKLCEDIQAALDDEDLERTLAAAAKAMDCENPEVRSHVVDALGWFGPDALPELVMMMGDKDEDVARSATDAWELGLTEIDDAKLRLDVSGMALKAVLNKDALESIGSQFSIAATELIDGEEDEKAASAARVKVVQKLADMIDSRQAALAGMGRELYEEITGNEWRGVEEAELYLRDPDNYELPEDREPAEADEMIPLDGN